MNHQLNYTNPKTPTDVRYIILRTVKSQPASMENQDSNRVQDTVLISSKQLFIEPPMRDTSSPMVLVPEKVLITDKHSALRTGSGTPENLRTIDLYLQDHVYSQDARTTNSDTLLYTVRCLLSNVLVLAGMSHKVN
jgi:hypothetical protein